MGQKHTHFVGFPISNNSQYKVKHLFFIFKCDKDFEGILKQDQNTSKFKKNTDFN